MPYWVEQTKGSHKDAIENVGKMYRKGIYTVEDAWSKFSALYLETHPNREPPSLQDHLNGRGSDVDYMLLTWFPFYANMWYSGPESKCESWARQHSRSGGNEYRVCYEY